MFIYMVFFIAGKAFFFFAGWVLVSCRVGRLVVSSMKRRCPGGKAAAEALARQKREDTGPTRATRKTVGWCTVAEESSAPGEIYKSVCARARTRWRCSSSTERVTCK